MEEIKYQNNGIGKELIKQTKLASAKAKLILLSAIKAVNYYPRIGMTKWEQCFVLDNINHLKQYDELQRKKIRACF